VLLFLKSANHIADNIWQFTFDPARILHWTPGQFIEVQLDHVPVDSKGVRRRFTIASAPYEERVSIVTRITDSSFKQALMDLQPGEPLTMSAEPAGDFIWQDSTFPHIYAAQGIGITPFYSIIRQRVHDGLPVNATLLYAHQPKAVPVFLDELQGLADKSIGLEIVEITGTLGIDDIIAHVPDFRSRLLYASGPKSLLRMSLKPYEVPLKQIKQDNFPGYSSAKY
jgi:ferredoxin-NADP reductase